MMITIDIIEVGHAYSGGDDALWLATYKGKDWVLFICYEFSHGVASPELVNAEWFDDEYIQNNWTDVTNDSYIQDIIGNLKYYDDRMLKYEC